MRVRSLLWLSLALFVASLAVVACGAADQGKRTGKFELVKNAPPGFEQARGTAEIIRSEGGTEATLDVKGLNPNTEFVSHLHVGSCDQPDPGGPHFKFDLRGSDMPPNEIHLPFTSDAEGKGSAKATNDQRAPDDEVKSVVIHRASAPHDKAEHPEGHSEGHAHQPKALCADLR